jgi:hypothetical protein
MVTEMLLHLCNCLSFDFMFCLFLLSASSLPSVTLDLLPPSLNLSPLTIHHPGTSTTVLDSSAPTKLALMLDHISIPVAAVYLFHRHWCWWWLVVLHWRMKHVRKKWERQKQAFINRFKCSWLSWCHKRSSIHSCPLIPLTVLVVICFCHFSLYGSSNFVVAFFQLCSINLEFKVLILSFFHHSHYMSKSLSDCISYFCVSCSIPLNMVRAILLFGDSGFTRCSRQVILTEIFHILHTYSRQMLRWYLKIGRCFISYHS